MTFQLRGVLPPVITPFTKSGAIDEEAFIANLESWNRYPLAGYLIAGSNSESVYLSTPEKLRLLQLAQQYAAPGRHIMMGTGIESLAETIHLTNLCADHGAMSALVLPPFYYGSSMTTAALADYFTRLADQSKLPILFYNVPKYTHLQIQPALIQQLARHPNIVGMKDSSGDVPKLVSFLQASAGQEFTTIIGTASAWYPGLTLGIESGIHALANCAPAIGAQIQQAYQHGNHELAAAIYQAICPLNSAVTATYGVAGLKYACTRLGFQGGYVRCPLQELGLAERNKLDNILIETATVLAALNVQL